MRKSAISKRIKASALSLVVAASLPAFSIGSGVSAVSLAGVSISTVKGLSTVMEADSVYKGTFSSSGAKSITFTIDSERVVPQKVKTSAMALMEKSTAEDRSK